MHTLLPASPADLATKSVFISCSRADLGPVRALALALRRTGLRTWMDLEDLRPGQRWKDAIGSALAAADAMVFCLSALSLESLPGPSRCPAFAEKRGPGTCSRPRAGGGLGWGSKAATASTPNSHPNLAAPARGPARPAGARCCS